MTKKLSIFVGFVALLLPSAAWACGPSGDELILFGLVTISSLALIGAILPAATLAIGFRDIGWTRVLAYALFTEPVGVAVFVATLSTIELFASVNSLAIAAALSQAVVSQVGFGIWMAIARRRRLAQSAELDQGIDA